MSEAVNATVFRCCFCARHEGMAPGVEIPTSEIAFTPGREPVVDHTRCAGGPCAICDAGKAVA